MRSAKSSSPRFMYSLPLRMRAVRVSASRSWRSTMVGGDLKIERDAIHARRDGSSEQTEDRRRDVDRARAGNAAGGYTGTPDDERDHDFFAAVAAMPAAMPAPCGFVSIAGHDENVRSARARHQPRQLDSGVRIVGEVVGGIDRAICVKRLHPACARIAHNNKGNFGPGGQSADQIDPPDAHRIRTKHLNAGPG